MKFLKGFIEQAKKVKNVSVILLALYEAFNKFIEVLETKGNFNDYTESEVIDDEKGES